MVHDLLSMAVWAWFCDNTTPTATVAASDLRLREHAGEDLLLYDFHAAARTTRAGVYITVGGGSRSTAVVTKNAFLEHELEEVLIYV
jgi:hypothetical protein